MGTLREQQHVNNIVRSMRKHTDDVKKYTRKSIDTSTRKGQKRLGTTLKCRLLSTSTQEFQHVPLLRR